MLQNSQNESPTRTCFYLAYILYICMYRERERGEKKKKEKTPFTKYQIEISIYLL